MRIIEGGGAARARPGAVDERRGVDAAALWSAIRAEHRARDERTARLRAMRVIRVDDDA